MSPSRLSRPVRIKFTPDEQASIIQLLLDGRSGVVRRMIEDRIAHPPPDPNPFPKLTLYRHRRPR